MKRYVSKDNGIGVELGDTVFNGLKGRGTSALQKETGGVLIGRYAADRKTASVLNFTGPPFGSKRSRLGFFRGFLVIKIKLKRDWKKYGKHYVGEWHTHPTGSPTPSKTDMETMHGIANDPKYQCPTPILIIVTNPIEPSLSVFVYVFSNDSPMIRLMPNDDEKPYTNQRLPKEQNHGRRMKL